MKRARFFVTWALVALMVIEPFALNMAAWAEEAAAVAQPAATDESTTTPKEEEKPATNEAATAAATEAQSGSEQVQGAGTKLDNTKEAKTKSFMGSGTKKKIKEANKQLGAAKTEVKGVQSTAKDAAGSVKEIGTAATGSGNTFEKLTKVKAAAQKALIKIGQLLQKIGQLLKTVGTALVSIGTALKAIPYTAAIGAALVAVGQILIKVGTALDYAGKAIEKIGNMAADTDKKFSDNIKDITGAAKDGWEAGGKAADKAATDAQASVDAGNKADTTKSAETGTSETTTTTNGEVTKPAQATEE